MFGKRSSNFFNKKPEPHVPAPLAPRAKLDTYIVKLGSRKESRVGVQKYDHEHEIKASSQRDAIEKSIDHVSAKVGHPRHLFVVRSARNVSDKDGLAAHEKYKKFSANDLEHLSHKTMAKLESVMHRGRSLIECLGRETRKK